MVSKVLPILQYLLCTFRSFKQVIFFFYRMSYSVRFVSWYFTFFAVWVMLCGFNWSGCHLVDMVQVHIAHMRCPSTRPHLKDERTNVKNKCCHINHFKHTWLDSINQDLLLWVSVISTVWDHFDNGAPCRVTSVQTIVHWPARPLCHGRMRGQHGSSIHWHWHPLNRQSG